MTYKIKRGKKKDLTEQEYKLLMKRKKDRISLSQLQRFGMRRYYQVPKRLHEKGKIVEYNGKIGKIKKVTPKGIYVQELKSNGIIKPTQKINFISEREIEAGRVYPVYPVVAM